MQLSLILKGLPDPGLYTSKIWLIMRLTALLLTISVLQVGAKSYAQQKITISKKNVSIENVFRDIRKQTGYHFLYSNEVVTESVPVSIHVKNSSLQEALNLCMKNQPLSYHIINKTVIVEINRKKLQAEDLLPFKISGRVVDESGKPLTGVTVRIKGSNIGTITGTDGKFSIEIPNSETVLQFSFLGYKTQEITVGNQSTLTIQMTPRASSLEQLVVVGYGETTRGDLTGSISSINGKDLVRTGAMSFGEALQGRLPGVQVNMQSGEPGSGVNIQIRGANSISASSTPLYVIDGMEIDVNEGEVATSDVGGYTTYNPLASINPRDIESIEVLKDASATAIYGARGANGVIIITTKSGSAGNPKLNFDVTYGLSEAPRRIKMLDAQEYLDYRFDFGSSSFLIGQDLNGDGSPDIPFNADDYDTYNWQDLLLRKGYNKKYHLSLQQGTKKMNYLLGAGYDKQEGVVASNDYTRFSANGKINGNITNKLKIGVSVVYGRTSTDGAVSSGGGAGSYSGLIQSMYTEKPVSLYVPGENEGINEYIPLTTMFFDSYKDVIYNSLQGSLFLEYEIIPGLKLRSSGFGRSTFSKMQQFYGKQTRWGKGENGRAGIQDVRTSSFQQSNTLTYKHNTGDRNLTIMLGQEINKYRSANDRIRVFDFEDESTGVYDLAKGNIVDKPTTYTYEIRRLSYFGRVNYNIDYKYYFTATFRADGSSNFGSGNRFGYFPSGAFAWKINKENFLRNVPAISNLKLRLSYGLTGNDRMSSYAALARLGISNYASNGNSIFGMAPSQSPNPNLKWEATSQTDIGVDFGLFNERFTLTADVYRKMTKDMLLSTPIPSQTGFSKQMQNRGDLENKGLELSISSDNINKGSFRWSTTLNFDLNRNKVTSLGDAEFLPVSIGNGYLTDVGRVIVGEPIGTGFGYVADGNYQMDDFIITNSAGKPADIKDITEANLQYYNYELKEGVTSIAGTTVRPGDRRYRDLNGDNVINADDRQVISNSNPDFNIGLSNQFNYKQFNLSFFFESVFGKDIMNSFIYRAEGGITGGAPMANIKQDYFYNRWTPTNPSNTYSGLKSNTNSFVSSYYVEDGSFVRFKNLSIGYTFDLPILRKMDVDNLSINFTVDNVLLWTKYSGLDPDVSSSTPLMRGYDRLSYPRARTYSLGIHLEF